MPELASVGCAGAPSLLEEADGAVGADDDTAFLLKPGMSSAANAGPKSSKGNAAATKFSAIPGSTWAWQGDRKNRVCD